MIRTIYGNHKRYKEVYFDPYPGKYFTGDGCKRDEDGFYRITGRVDDIVNFSGHRIGTAEVEDAINSHSKVIESAVVGVNHTIKGQSICAFVIISDSKDNVEMLKKDINDQVCDHIGSIARPQNIHLISGLPKTRSVKIMRRILRKIAEGEKNNFGNTSTLIDSSEVDKILAGLN